MFSFPPTLLERKKKEVPIAAGLGMAVTKEAAAPDGASPPGHGRFPGLQPAKGSPRRGCPRASRAEPLSEA